MVVVVASLEQDVELLLLKLGANWKPGTASVAVRFPQNVCTRFR